LSEDFLKDTTDWNDRSKYYNNLQWVKSPKLNDVLLEVIGDLSNKKCIDIGCGPGIFSNQLLERNKNGRFYCLDASKEMLNMLNNEAFCAIHSSIEELAGFDDFFDVAVAKMVFHHIPDMNVALNKIHSILRGGGVIHICEGHPPNRYCIDFYAEMFSYKEDRHTLTIDDIVFALNKSDFRSFHCKSVVLKKMSLNNWLDNSGVKLENKKIIFDMHKNAPDFVKDAYSMTNEGDDILMDWFFSIVTAQK